MREHPDLRPGAILSDLNLRRPIYAKTAAYGHFGRPDHDFTWERTDKVAALRAAAGIAQSPAPTAENLGYSSGEMGVISLSARRLGRRPSRRTAHYHRRCLDLRGAGTRGRS